MMLDASASSSAGPKLVSGSTQMKLSASKFRSGKKSAFPEGTTQRSRVACPDTLKTPPRKKTGPDCPTPHRSPVKSVSGFVEAGMENAHCHQRACHSL